MGVPPRLQNVGQTCGCMHIQTHIIICVCFMFDNHCMKCGCSNVFTGRRKFDDFAYKLKKIGSVTVFFIQWTLKASMNL